MPYAINSGVRIHYEVEGEGPPLVLHHGLAGCGEDWRDFGLTAVLRRTHRLILIDGRAFGASDKPHDPHAYTVAARVGDVTAVEGDLEHAQEALRRLCVTYHRLAPGMSREP